MVTMAKELEFAINLVAECASLARRIQAQMVTSAMEKSDRSPVTVADYALQALVGKRLRDEFPESSLVAEESSHTIRKSEGTEISSVIAGFLMESIPDVSPKKVHDWIDIGGSESGERYWILDPIDGTKGFLRKAHYAVALALIEEGEVILGVLGCPSLSMSLESGSWVYEFSSEGPGEILYAQKGQGTWIKQDDHDLSLKVSKSSDAMSARVLRSFESGHTDTSMMSSIVDLIGTVQDPVLMDSQAKYSLLASGCGDLLFRLISPKAPDYREKIWDQAAGVVIVREAGGRITDLDGKELDFTTGRRLERNRGIIGSNGHLHDLAVAAVKKLGA